MRPCSYGEYVEQVEFCEAMSRCGAAVHVVTTDGVAGKAGFTATAFSSVSRCRQRYSVLRQSFRIEFADPASQWEVLR